MIFPRLRVPALAATVAGSLLGCGSAAAVAQDFPDRPVKVIVPFAPGGSLDLVARLIADRLSKTWSQPVVIENKPGANGIVGVNALTQAAADGYAILFATSPIFTINKYLYKNLPYDPDKDLVPVSQAAVAPNVLGAYPKLPFVDFQQLIAYARAHPNELTFASQGNGSTGELTGLLLNQMAGLKIRHIPYHGAALAWNDVLAGHVDMMWDGIPSVLSQIRAGTVRALAVGSRQRSAALPDVPTAVEEGLSDFESESWYAAAVLRGTPDPIVQKISAAIADAIHSPAIAARLTAVGARPVGSTPEQMRAAIKSTAALWRRVIEVANIHSE
jgi:tripartite-type tricarboxylate transporter receptor subunit TctC